MQGSKGPHGGVAPVDTVIDPSGRMAVLKSSAQCFPIFSFHKDFIRPNDSAHAGNKSLDECHVAVQHILDEFLNDGQETRPSRHPEPPPRPHFVRRAAVDSRWRLRNMRTATDEESFIKNVTGKTEHIYVAPSLIDGSSISYSPTAKMVYYRNETLTCLGFDQGTIVIKYIIKKDKQRAFHPNPGEFHSHLQRVAFLPDNPEGNDVLKRLEGAFLRGQTFCVGPKTTDSLPNEVDWVIPHKTLLATGENGFPDPNFFDSVKNVLDAFELMTNRDLRPDIETGLASNSLHAKFGPLQP